MTTYFSEQRLVYREAPKNFSGSASEELAKAKLAALSGNSQMLSDLLTSVLQNPQNNTEKTQRKMSQKEIQIYERLQPTTTEVDGKIVTTWDTTPNRMQNALSDLFSNGNEFDRSDIDNINDRSKGIGSVLAIIENSTNPETVRAAIRVFTRQTGLGNEKIVKQDDPNRQKLLSALYTLYSDNTDLGIDNMEPQFRIKEECLEALVVIDPTKFQEIVARAIAHPNGNLSVLGYQYCIRPQTRGVSSKKDLQNFQDGLRKKIATLESSDVDLDTKQKEELRIAKTALEKSEYYTTIFDAAGELHRHSGKRDPVTNKMRDSWKIHGFKLNEAGTASVEMTPEEKVREQAKEDQEIIDALRTLAKNYKFTEQGLYNDLGQPLMAVMSVMRDHPNPEMRLEAAKVLKAQKLWSEYNAEHDTLQFPFDEFLWEGDPIEDMSKSLESAKACLDAALVLAPLNAPKHLADAIAKYDGESFHGYAIELAKNNNREQVIQYLKEYIATVNTEDDKTPAEKKDKIRRNAGDGIAALEGDKK